MNKLRLIIAREYMSIVGRKSFIIMTLLFPFLMIAIGSVPVLMAYFNNSGDQTQQIAVIDETGQYASALTNDNMFNFVAIKGDTLTNAREFYDKSKGSISAVIIIPRDVDSTGIVNIYSEETITPSLESTVRNALSDTIENAHLAAMGIPNLQQIVEKAHVNIDVHAIKWNEAGDEKESSTDAAMILGLALSFIIFWFVLFSGTMVMNNVVEEKTNRIVEVVVSSCRPFHLMLGKIIGVGLSVLTQMGIWILLLGIAGTVGGSLLGITGSMPSAEMMEAGAAAAPEVQGALGDFLKQALSINYTPIIINFLLYFIEGYLLYCAIFAALGSAVDQASDTSQLLWPVMILMMFAFYAAMGCIENPNGPMAFWCSIIPFTSPIVMMVRLPYDVPVWQMLLSHALLLATALAIVWCAGRIYRRGILHYGQKASFGSLIKWLK
ncbi:MAG: ABC transporter permease [Muribaculaceae bacterium]|nr:ABC transporter permease [Muribaculaceae bacterium]